MAFEELLEWAGTRCPWQQDALRRIALQGEITEDDISELRAQIEQSAGLCAEGSPEASPLTGDHLAATADDAPATVLASLGPVENVDRLEPGQPPCALRSTASPLFMVRTAVERAAIAASQSNSAGP